MIGEVKAKGRWLNAGTNQNEIYSPVKKSEDTAAEYKNNHVCCDMKSLIVM